MNNEGNVKTKASQFTHVKKVHTRERVVNLNMHVYVTECCVSVLACVCVCVRTCVRASALRLPSTVRSQQKYQGNSSESDRGGKLIVTFTSAFLSVNCALWHHQGSFKSHLSQGRLRAALTHQYIQTASGWKQLYLHRCHRLSWDCLVKNGLFRLSVQSAYCDL